MQELELPFTGMSMLPTLKGGDLLLVLPMKEKLSAGDIVVTKYTDQVVAHRLIKKNLMKGDRAGGVEEVGDILGIVVGFLRGNKKVFWGEVGQPLKKLLATLSRKTLIPGSRLQRRFFLFLIFLVSSLSYFLSSRDHKKKHP